MGMKAAGADLLFKGGLYNGNRFLALFSGLSPLTEISGNSYARLARTLTNWKADGAGYINDGNFDFPAPQPAGWPAIVGYGLYSATTGGTLYYDFDSTDTAAPALGAPVGFLDSTIGYRFTGVTDTGGQLSCSAGLLSGTRALSLHSQAPGATGGNQIDDSVVVTAGQWTVDTQAADGDAGTPKRRRAQNNVIIDWGVQTSDVAQPTHIALRDGTGTGANVLWSNALPVATDDPALGDTIQAAVNALKIYIPID